MNFLPYIYEPDKSLEVYEKTQLYFQQNPAIKTRIEELGWIYHTVGMIIPQNFENFWSGHNFPFDESWDELQISFNLVCFGFYKQAFVSLRSGLELGLLSVYYNINDDGHNAVKEWLSSKDSREANTPRAETIWKILLSDENIKKFNEKHNLRQTFDDLGYLHNYVHTKGAKYSNTLGNIVKSNFQSFESKAIEKWLNTYIEVISLISSLHLLKYPISVVRFDYFKKFGINIPNFGNLEEFNIDKIAKILPENYLQDIEKIAKEDSRTKQIINDITQLPNKTEEEVENQIIDLEKSLIKGMGFSKWLETQQHAHKLFNADFSETMINRVEFLKKWAIENDYYIKIKSEN